MTDGEFVPKADYDQVVTDLAALEVTAKLIVEENKQLKEALQKVNAGIKRASDIVEGIARIHNQQMITDLAFSLIKHHPTHIIIKYKGETVTDVKAE